MLPHRSTSAAALQTRYAIRAATFSTRAPRPVASILFLFSLRFLCALCVSALKTKPLWFRLYQVRERLDRPKMRPIHSLTLLCLIGLLGGCSQTKPTAQAEPKKEPEPSYFKVDPSTAGRSDRGRSIHRQEARPQDHRYEWRPGLRGVSPREGSGRIGRCQSEWHARQRVRLYQERLGREDIRGARDAGQARPAWLLVSASRSGNSDRSTAGDHEFRPGDTQCSPARPAQSRVEPQPGTWRGPARAKVPQTRGDDSGQVQHP